MKYATKITRILLSFALVANTYGMIPTYAKENQKTVLIAGSDYQGGSDAGSASNVRKILNQMKENGIEDPDGFIWPGDYNIGHVDASTTNTSIASLKETVSTIYPTLNDDNMVLSAGNHETDMANGINVWPTGPYEFDTYSVYVINEDDFPWESNSWNDNDFEASYYEGVVQNTATQAMNYFNTKIQEGYTKPIFILCHVPLHFTNRTNNLGDGEFASYLFNVFNKAGAAGLNLFFLYGHNHGGGAEDFHGGGAVYYQKGDTIYIPNTGCVKGGNYAEPRYNPRVLNFTYLNAGYTGYLQSKTGVCSHLTMTAYAIDETSVEIKRFSSEGLHELKGPGSNSNTTPDLSLENTYESGQVIKLSNVNRSMLIDNYDENKELDGTWPEDLDFSVKSISLNTHALTLDEGESYQLKASLLPTTARNKNVEWTCDRDDLITLDQTGLIKAKKNLKTSGMATITATSEDGQFTDSCQVKVIAEVDMIHVQAITSPKEMDVYIGDVVPFETTLTPKNATNPTCTYTSEDKTIASVDEEGKIHAHQLGKTTISATTKDGNFTTKTIVHVIPIPVRSIAFIEKEKTMITGNTEKFELSILPDNATDQTILYTSSDPLIASVDEQGNVTAKRVGNVEIVATSKDGHHKDTCTLTVLPISVESIQLDATSISLVVGSSRTLQVAFTPSDAANQSVRWTSSDETIATVQDGIVQAKKEGSATITATSVDGNRKAKCKVYVTKDVVKEESVSIDFDQLILPEGQSYPLTASVTPANTSNPIYTWACYYGGEVEGNIFTATIAGAQTSVHVHTKQWKSDKADVIVAKKSNVQYEIVDDTLYVHQGDISSQTPWQPYLENIHRVILSKDIHTITKKTLEGLNDVELICLDPEIEIEDGALDGISQVYAYAHIKEGQIYLSDTLSIQPDTIDLKPNETTTIQLYMPYELMDVQKEWSYDDILSLENLTLTALKPGQSTLTLHMDDQEASCLVNVSKPQIETIEFEQTEYNLQVGDQVSLNPIFTPSDADLSSLVWTSSDPDVVSIENGEIQALQPGLATITVSSNEQSATILVNVEGSEENETLLGYSISAGDVIALHYHMDIPDSILKQGPVMKYKDQVIKPTFENGVYTFTCKVNAKEMTDDIQAVLSYGQTEHSYTYSVQDYVQYLLTHEYDAKDQAMAKAMLSYGYYAQEYFQYHLENERKLESVALSEIPDTYALTNRLDSFVGARLVLESTTGIKLYFSQGTTFLVDGMEQTTTTEDGYIVLTIKNILPKEMDRMYQISVDGNEFSYGIFTFGYIAQNSQNTSLSNVMQAMYSYYASTIEKEEEPITEEPVTVEEETPIEQVQEEIPEETIEPEPSLPVLDAEVYDGLVNEWIQDLVLEPFEINEESIQEAKDYLNHLETMEFDETNETTFHIVLKRIYDSLKERDVDLQAFEEEYMNEDGKIFQDINQKLETQ